MSDPASALARLHHEIRLNLSGAANRDFQGLQSAGRYLRLGNILLKKLGALDACVSWNRHITPQRAQRFLDQIDAALQGQPILTSSSSSQKESCQETRDMVTRQESIFSEPYLNSARQVNFTYVHQGRTQVAVVLDADSRHIRYVNASGQWTPWHGSVIESGTFQKTYHVDQPHQLAFRNFHSPLSPIRHTLHFRRISATMWQAQHDKAKEVITIGLVSTSTISAAEQQAPQSSNVMPESIVQKWDLCLICARKTKNHEVCFPCFSDICCTISGQLRAPPEVLQFTQRDNLETLKGSSITKKIKAWRVKHAPPPPASPAPSSASSSSSHHTTGTQPRSRWPRATRQDIVVHNLPANWHDLILGYATRRNACLRRDGGI